MKEYFIWYDKNPQKPDNQVLHLAQLIKFAFPTYETKQSGKNDVMAQFFSIAGQNPELMGVLTDQNLSDQDKGIKAIMMCKDHPELISMLLEMGQFGKE